MAAEATALPSHWRQTLQCPKHHTPLTDAEALIPCMHRVCRLCTEILFRFSSAPSEKKCPQCDKPVQAHYPDGTIRDIVRDILFQTGEISTRGNPPPARFVCIKPWGPRSKDSEEHSCTFSSVTEDSLFTEICITGSYDGTLWIRLLCNPHYRQVVYDHLIERGCEWMKDEGYIRPLFEEGKIYADSNSHDIKKLFEIAIKDNHFPEEDLPWIREFLDARKWKEPPPSLLESITSFFATSQHAHNE